MILSRTFVSDLVDQLDLSAISTVYEDGEQGQPTYHPVMPYHPVMTTKVLVNAYCVGVFSSRKILGGHLKPDHSWTGQNRPPRAS